MTADGSKYCDGGHFDDAAAIGLALNEARDGAAEGEVPVGAVLVAGNKVVARAHNQPIALRDPTAHAEILALRAGAKLLDTYRLTGTSLYVTLEPCLMCIGAIVHARVARVIYGARDPKAGALGSVFDLGRDGRLNHQLEVHGGICADQCAALLREFFRSRRGAS
ncbi:MAG TPA: tRNA adenosine(34) deaminase TadA [Candidatus Binataceae bacterium]|nr:tRNA adenosine(34) deaminase TadA [Candidatus Binataceae bacterium]